MSSTQKQYQVPMDCHQLPTPDFHIGQKVFISAEHICTTRPAKTLSEEYLGPYEIIARPGTHSFILQLPEHMCAIHPVFHISQLEPEIVGSGTFERGERKEKNEREHRHRHLMATTVVGTTARNQLLL